MPLTRHGGRRPSGLRACLAALLPAAALAGLPPAAHAVPAGTQQATGGAVAATLSWKASAEKYGGVTAPRLRIERAGIPALDAGIADLCDGCFFSAFEEPNVRVADLDGDGEPEVLVTTFTGGAHCCTDLGIWDYRADLGTYGHLVQGFGNGGFRLRDIDRDGSLELESIDDRFAYAFTSYAESVDPPQILRWSRTPQVGLTDVTRRFGELIRRDAARLRRILRGRTHRGEDLRGVLAAYVADMYLIDRGREGLGEIARVQRRGGLGAATDTTWPGGSRYRPALLEFLRTTGYR